MALDLIIRHPERFKPLQSQSVELRTLTAFFKAEKTRNPALLETRLASIRSSQHLTQDEAVIEPNKLQAIMLVDMLRVILGGIKTYDKEIAELAPKHDDYDLFSSLPGAGPSLAPRLLVAFGEQGDRFKNAAELQKYLGIAPVTERSGNKHWVHWRWRLPSVRQTDFR